MSQNVLDEIYWPGLNQTKIDKTLVWSILGTEEKIQIDDKFESRLETLFDPFLSLFQDESLLLTFLNVKCPIWTLNLLFFAVYSVCARTSPKAIAVVSHKSTSRLQNGQEKYILTFRPTDIWRLDIWRGHSRIHHDKYRVPNSR